MVKMTQEQVKKFIKAVKDLNKKYYYQLEQIGENKSLIICFASFDSSKHLQHIVQVSTNDGELHNVHPINGYISSDRVAKIESHLKEAYAIATKEAE